MAYRAAKNHDASQCTCGKTPVDAQEPVLCPCVCEECVAHARRVHRAKSIESLLSRWAENEIDPAVVADIVWMHIEPTIEQMVNRLVDARLQEKLRDLRLHAKVWRVDIDRISDNPEPKN